MCGIFFFFFCYNFSIEIFVSLSGDLLGPLLIKTGETVLMPRLYNYIFSFSFVGKVVTPKSQPSCRNLSGYLSPSTVSDSVLHTKNQADLMLHAVLLVR